MINTIGHIGFFFPVVGCLVYTSWNRAILSWVQNEAVSVSIWQPPLYPFRTIVAVGFSLILLQGVVVFARDAHKLISGKVRLP